MRYAIPLDRWDFSIDALSYAARVTVPHTWNTDDAVMRYRGEARYETEVFVDADKQGLRAYLSFRAVYHSARVWVNGTFAGAHSRSGYTPFELDVTQLLRFGEKNTVTVSVDNTHTEELLPHGGDFDWADDGGLIRAVTLRFAPPDAIRYLYVEETLADIDGAVGSGTLRLKTAFADGGVRGGTVRIVDRAEGRVVLERVFDRIENEVTLDFARLKLWSCRTPNLYQVSLETDTDRLEVKTGLRRIEVKGDRILLNGADIFLKGCEWMPGSHPVYGMAEPLSHSVKCLEQLRDAGCVFTRFHWQQDDALYDWCDENGLLVQEEIPYWGYPKQAAPLQTQIAEQQAREMVAAHRNHPSIICWGVGNELGAETAPTIAYIRHMVSYFKSLDARRLVNYVSNTLSRVENEGKDDGTLYGDIAMWNDYLGLWEPSEDIEAHARRTAEKCAGMPLVVSEFGLCEPHFSGGDERRAAILRERLALYAAIPAVRGYVWFSLNDYRTHVGEEGDGRFRRRVHGSVDWYGNEKPSYRLLQALQTDEA